MLNKSLILFLFICLSIASEAQKTDKVLESKLRQLTAGFEGDVGIYVKHLITGKTASYQADSIFPTASMIKVPILIGIMNKLEKKELSYHQPLVYRDSLLYEGEDILGSFKDGQTIQLAKVIMLMMTTSDNTASLWLQSLAGTGTQINSLLDTMGFLHTRVNSRTPGRKENQQLFGWGQTTPKEMVRLMELMYQGKLVSKEASAQMLRIMGRNFWDEEAISVHPPTVFIASKNGAVDASRSETLLVMAPNGPYIFSIITKNQKDTSWNSNNAGWVLARQLARLLWVEYGGRERGEGK